MFNTGLPTTNQQFPLGALNELGGGTSNIGTAYTASRMVPVRDGRFVTALGGVPTCSASGSMVCAAAIDRTSLVPCATVGATSWPGCQKPTMWNLYPR
jgi:hypothetical protein